MQGRILPVSDDARYHGIVPDFEFWKQMIPCQAACPIHTDAGKYVQLIAEGRDLDSYLTARSPNPFASICGRVCAAPCTTNLGLLRGPRRFFDHAALDNWHTVALRAARTAVMMRRPGGVTW